MASALLAVVVALALALLERRGKMEVQLVFVGCTNYTTTTANRGPGSPVLTANVFSAIVMATNSGDVAVELYTTLRTVTVWLNEPAMPHRDNLAMPTRMNLPRMLKPGETLLVEVVPQTLGVPWSTELMAQRRSLGDRLYVKAKTKGGAAARRIITRCLSPPPQVLATLGPITNAPLDINSIQYLMKPYLRTPETLLDNGTYR